MHSHTRSHKYLAASAYEIKTEKQSSIRATERKIRFRHTCTNTQYTHAFANQDDHMFHFGSFPQHTIFFARLLQLCQVNDDVRYGQTNV